MNSHTMSREDEMRYGIERTKGPEEIYSEKVAAPVENTLPQGLGATRNPAAVVQRLCFAEHPADKR